MAKNKAVNTAIIAGASLGGLYLATEAAKMIAGSLRESAENVRETAETTSGTIDRATEEAAEYRETVAGYAETLGTAAGRVLNIVTLPARYIGGLITGETLPPPMSEGESPAGSSAIESAQNAGNNADDFMRACEDGSIIDVRIESCADGSTPRRF